MYVDQRDHVKQKISDLRINLLDVYYNLTKYLIRSFLSGQFRNIEFDSKSCSLEYQYLCFYVGFSILNGYVLGFEFEIMINSNLRTSNLILDGLMHNI